MNKLRIATIGVLAVAMLLPSTVLAQEEAPERHGHGTRAAGEIIGVVPGQGTFTLLTRQGKELEFQTNEDTKFRGPDGSVEGIHDLEKGMKALVVAAEQDDGTLLALLIAAGEPKERPEVIRLQGEITGVVPGQGTFTIVNREGNEFELSTNDRTKFHSRDGSISDIHDLKRGMQAIVGAVRQDDGQLLALAVAAGNPENRSDRPVLDVTVGGKVTAIGSSSFTIETRNGESMSFSVNDSTHYKGIGSFSELEVGMMAAVGADESDDGLLAIFVGARNPEDRPNRRPGHGPNPRDPGQGQGQDEEVSA